MLFVLLARDEAAPAAIQAWINARVSLGLNKPGDPQLVEAGRCAEIMTQQRLEIRAAQ